MSTLQESLTNPTQAGATQRGARRPNPAPVALKPRSADQILAAAKARMETRRQRARQTPDAGSIQVIVALLESREMFQSEYDELDRNRALFPDAGRQLAEIKQELDQIKADLDYFLNPQKEEGESDITFEGRRHQLLLSVEQASRIVGLRTAARSWTDAITATTEPDTRTITAFLEDVAGNILPFVTDVDEKSPKKLATWKGRSLGSVMPEDDVVTEVVKAFGKMVKTFTDKKEKEDDDVVQLLNHAGYYISDEEVAALRRNSESAPLTKFLGDGEGRFTVIGYKYGESLVLERRSGRVYPHKASGAKIGKMAFLFRDRETRILKAISHDRLRPLEHTGTNVSKVWHDQIREALEFQLRREAENAEKREASRELRNVSGLEDLITTYELAILNKVGTCLMNYRLRNGERSVEVTYRLASDGTGVWVSDFVPGAIDKADPKKVWLAKMLDPNKPMAIAELRKLREWKEASQANGYSETEWQTEREAKRLGATAITRTNQDNLMSVENGVGGTYTFTTTSRRRNQNDPDRPYYVSIGIAMTREGSKVKPVWATPGAQAEFRKMGDDWQEITDLKPVTRALLQNLYVGVNGIHRRDDGWLDKVPVHLRRAERNESDDTQEVAEE